ncbi:MAG: Type I restriction enzyme R protein N terminus (HSDR-N) [Candidatus Nitrotoga sp. LAW]|nr:MAG: Type I restriction enzyme R protein N terminus (HSDR-N) [Candidatus Nitrotoga sp. LAW]
MAATETRIEQDLIAKLEVLNYIYRPDIRDREALETNFREKFEALNRVKLTDSEFSRLRDEIVTPDVFAAARHLRERNSFERDDGMPLFYTLVNIKDWCKNSFEVINQLRINTDNSHHRNEEHRHSAINFVTPAERHAGLDRALIGEACHRLRGGKEQIP